MAGEAAGQASDRYRREEALGPVRTEGTTVDLHTHTRRSDGLLEPRALVEAAAAAGVRLLAVTDHDSLVAVRELRDPDAPPLPAGLELVAGLELNSRIGDRELHILGYGLDPRSDALEARLAELRAERRRRFQRILARLRELGCSVDGVLAGLDLDRTEALGRPTIARALVAAGHAASVTEAFGRFLGRGGPAYVPRPTLDPATAIRLVREAGGLAVLAHPADLLLDERLLPELVAVGLAGLEVHYRGYPRDVVDALADLAARYRLLATGGTDYHGDDGPYEAAARSVVVPAAVGRRLTAALAGARAGLESSAARREKPTSDPATLIGR